MTTEYEGRRLRSPSPNYKRKSREFSRSRSRSTTPVSNRYSYNDERRVASRSRSPQRSFNRDSQYDRPRYRSRSPYSRYSRRYNSRSRSPPRYSRRTDRYQEGGRYSRTRSSRRIYRGTEEERSKSTTLFVGNIPYSFNQADIMALFDGMGPIKKITIPLEYQQKDRNKGFAFVQWEDRKDAEDALKAINGRSMDGRELRLDWDVGLETKEDSHRR